MIQKRTRLNTGALVAAVLWGTYLGSPSSAAPSLAMAESPTTEEMPVEAPLPHYVKAGFCRSRTLRDFSAPLETLPRIREIPLSRELPFTPARISFSNESDQIIVSGDPLAYRFSGKPERPLLLNVRSRLARISRDGRPLHVVKEKVERVRISVRSSEKAIGFAQSPKPGLYRYDLIFSRAGSKLGRYQAYYRVVRKTLDIRLSLNNKEFRAGDRILGVVENYTAESVDYVTSFKVQRRVGDDWMTIRSHELFGYPVKFRHAMLVSGPGSTGPCSVLLVVPETLSPGRYRVLKAIGIFWRMAGQRGPRRIAADFIVRG
jgi:hypothetical protein